MHRERERERERERARAMYIYTQRETKRQTERERASSRGRTRASTDEGMELLHGTRAEDVDTRVGIHALHSPHQLRPRDENTFMSDENTFMSDENTFMSDENTFMPEHILESYIWEPRILQSYIWETRCALPVSAWPCEKERLSEGLKTKPN